MHTHLVKYYVYKLTFKSGATYIGSHVQHKENDGYITSSSYYKKNIGKDDLVSREILVYANDKHTMDILETAAIMDDKAYSPNNVNYNFGNYALNFGFSITFETRSKASKTYWSKLSKEERMTRLEKCHAATRGVKKGKLSEEHKAAISKGTKEAMAHLSKEKKAQMAEKRRRHSRKGQQKGKKWYTDGTTEIRAYTCPGENFRLGRIPKKRIPWNKGKKMSDEFKQKCSNSLKGHTSWNKGKKMSEEFCQKMSERNKGRIPWNKGLKMSDEFKKKCSDSLKGHIPWNKGKKKITEAA